MLRATRTVVTLTPAATNFLTSSEFCDLPPPPSPPPSFTPAHSLDATQPACSRRRCDETHCSPFNPPPLIHDPPRRQPCTYAAGRHHHGAPPPRPQGPHGLLQQHHGRCAGGLPTLRCIGRRPRAPARARAASTVASLHLDPSPRVTHASPHHARPPAAFPLMRTNDANAGSSQEQNEKLWSLMSSYLASGECVVGWGGVGAGVAWRTRARADVGWLDLRCAGRRARLSPPRIPAGGAALSAETCGVRGSLCENTIGRDAVAPGLGYSWGGHARNPRPRSRPPAATAAVGTLEGVCVCVCFCEPQVCVGGYTRSQLLWALSASPAATAVGALTRLLLLQPQPCSCYPTGRLVGTFGTNPFLRAFAFHRWAA